MRQNSKAETDAATQTMGKEFSPLLLNRVDEEVRRNFNSRILQDRIALGMATQIDAHLSPAIATWITDTFGVKALTLRDLGLRDAEEPEIFEAAKAQGVIFMTKDSDFVDLVDRLGAPPQIIWLTCGNTSNVRFCQKH